MLVALPSAIAFGVTIFSPLGSDYGAKGALAGMLGVMTLGLIAALVGGTQRLISAPCAPAAAVLSALAIQLAQQDQSASTVVLTLFLVVIASSLTQILFGVLQIGRLIRYMPFTVVSGYLSGVGLIIIFSQVPKWLALPKGMKFWPGVIHFEQWHLASVLIGLATAIVMVLGPRISKKVPAVILGLLAGILAYWTLAVGVWPELGLGLYRGRLCWRPPAASARLSRDVGRASPLSIDAPGAWPLPEWGGVLHVTPCREGGVSPERLRSLSVAGRSGSERFQMGAGRPPRVLKKQFQMLGVPAWERDAPLFWDGEQLLFVPGLGVDARCLAPSGQDQWTLRWVRLDAERAAALKCEV